jgi:hypothetical protein
MAGVTEITAIDPRIGRPVSDLDTPTLLLDRAASDHNLAKMATFFQDRPAKLRPHFKNHKCTTLAKRQLAAVMLSESHVRNLVRQKSLSNMASATS